jgi:stage II sporulation protein P
MERSISAMMMRITKRIVLPLLLAAFFALFAAGTEARADDWYGDGSGYYTVQDEYGQILFRFGGAVYIDDEYISGDNKRYQIVEVDDEARRAVARYVEDIPSLMRSAPAFYGAAARQPVVALYCTHSDESYTPTDGSESKKNGGGILDVAAEFEKYLKQMGCDVVRSDTTHEPHDAGAYRRSRSTAVQLMKNGQPDMLCDIHRDSVPAEDYEKDISGENASRVRIVVGRSNQNRSANEEFARQIKEVADERYPGLVKDIYIGKGTYNQDLMPQALLFEMGTSEIEKEKVINSTRYLAEVVAVCLGLETGQGQGDGSPQPRQTGQPQGMGGENGNYQPRQQAAQDPAQTRADKNSGAGRSILWIVIVLALVGVLTLIITVRQGQFKSKVGGFFKEITGVGHKHRSDDPRNRM